MPIDIEPALYREALGHYPTGVAVVTAVMPDSEPIGMVVGTFSSVSLDPPLISFLPMLNSKTFALLRTAEAFCINVLAADQEALCRQFASGGAHKFDGVEWRPSELGAPILDGAVSWVECTFEDVREAGDHYIVLGRVNDLAVQRSTLPLLFFQGGYGRFSPGSFIAAPDPELIQAAHVAQRIRTQVEDISSDFSVNCSVIAKLRWDAVQLLASNQSPVEEPFPLGHRQPLIPPFGAAFMAHASEEDIDTWLGRTTYVSDEGRELNRQRLTIVREQGYSLLATDTESLRRRHQEALAAFEQNDRLPRDERKVRELTSELANFFVADLVPGERYDLANVVVILDTEPGIPPMALRITGLPQGVTSEQIEAWVSRLKQVSVGA